MLTPINVEPLIEKVRGGYRGDFNPRELTALYKTYPKEMGLWKAERIRVKSDSKLAAAKMQLELLESFRKPFWESPLRQRQEMVRALFESGHTATILGVLFGVNTQDLYCFAWKDLSWVWGIQGEGQEKLSRYRQLEEVR